MILSIFSTLISCIFGLICTLILIFVIKDLICLYRMMTIYKKNGFVADYIPLLGFILKYVHMSKDPDGGKVCEEMMEQSFSKEKSEAKDLSQPRKYEHIHPGVIFNDFSSTRCIIFLTDPALIRELYVKEKDYFCRGGIRGYKFDLGFFFKSGDQALKERTIFSEAFKISSLEKMLPRIHDSFEEVVNSKVLDPQSNQLQIADSTKLLSEIFTSISEKILFGTTSEEVFPKALNGGTFASEITDVLSLQQKVASHPLNIFSFGLCHRYELLADSKACGVRARHLRSELQKFFKVRTERLKQTNSKGSADNLVDILIQYNLSPDKDMQISEDSSLGAIFMFMLASYDTTLTLMRAVFFHLAHKPEIQEKVRQEVESLGGPQALVDAESLEKLEYLDSFIKEILRVHPPVGVSFPKLALNNVKLGDQITIKKGDVVFVPHMICGWNPNFFPQQRTFNKNLDSFNSTNRRDFHPFSSGRRNCVGKTLAEFETKILTARFVSAFNIIPLTQEKDATYNLEFLFVLNNAKVAFSKR